MTGTVFSIEEFSVYDGPGIRTTVFLKGCPLRCSWCHNPEGQQKQVEIIRSPNGCTGCGNCEKYSDWQNGKYIFTDKSIKNCPMNLLRECGEVFTEKALCDRLLKNSAFFEQDGGVTFSGGEPLMQSGFVFECLKILKGKLHTAIQTCGYCEQMIFDKALALSDYFLYDIKLADNSLHKKYTGVSNDIILSNFKKLARSGKDFVVRIPLIPNVTDTKENIGAICRLLKSNGVGYAELLPYNKMAGGKYKMLRRNYSPEFDETADVSIRPEIFKEYEIETKVL